MFTAAKGIYEGQGYEIVTLAGAGHEVRILPAGEAFACQVHMTVTKR